MAASPDPNTTSGPNTGSCTTPIMHLDAAGQHRLDEHPLQPRPEVGRQRPVALGHFLRGAQIDPDAPGVGPVHQPLGLGLDHHRGRRAARRPRRLPPPWPPPWWPPAGRRSRTAARLRWLRGSQPPSGEPARKPATRARASAARSPSSSGTFPRCRPRQARYRTAWSSARAALSGVGVTGHSGDRRRRHVDDCRGLRPLPVRRRGTARRAGVRV